MSVVPNSVAVVGGFSAERQERRYGLERERVNDLDTIRERGRHDGGRMMGRPGTHSMLVRIRVMKPEKKQAKRWPSESG